MREKNKYINVKDIPETMEPREWLTKLTASETGLPLNVVKRVIEHNYSAVTEAMEKHNGIEVLVFGNFYFNTGKAQNTVNKYKRLISEVEEKIKETPLTDSKKHISLKLEMEKLTGARELFHRRGYYAEED